MTWSATYTGKKFDYLNLNPDNICIEDIAHALSQICRFGGHCERFYSVAEHSVWLTRYFILENRQDSAKYALLHDAAEAYVGDVLYPLKLVLPLEHKKLERDITDIIIAKYGLHLKSDAISDVDKADKRLMLAEASQLNGRWNINEWHPLGEEPLDVIIQCWTPPTAEDKFLDAFNRLFGDDAT